MHRGHVQPDDHLTMRALVTLEQGMNIPVLTKLHSMLGDLKERIKLTDACAEPHTVERIILMKPLFYQM